MKRTKLTDGTNRWFDSDSAEVFKETTWWNGRNWISKATNDQWQHEMLFRTKSGRWILNEYSDYQGSGESYEEITDREAAAWFMKNEYSDDDIPDNLHKLIAGHIADLEV